MPDDELPEFQKASDMMWAIFEAHVPEAQRHEMKVFAALAIVNKETNSLIKRAFEATNQEYSGQPVTFSMESDEGKAILGTFPFIASKLRKLIDHFYQQARTDLALRTSSPSVRILSASRRLNRLKSITHLRDTHSQT